MKDMMIGVDLAKNVFQLHGASMTGQVLFRKKLSQGPVSSLHGEPASRCCRDGGLRQRPLLGAGVGETGP